MTGTDWGLLIAVPAAILAAGAVAAALMRWQAKASVLWVLKSSPSEWAALAKEVKEFEPLFRAGEMVGRLAEENLRLHTMITDKLAALPIYTWSYKAESRKVRHMGPTAQAFQASFHLGDTDRAIATVDADGVALAAAKALEARTTEMQQTIDELRAELRQLRAEMRTVTAAGRGGR